jgi:hypothetical protein
MNAPDDASVRLAVPPAVGVRQPLIDGVEKVTGRALYTADLPARHALVGAILRSPLPHARIRGIDTRAARAMPGVRAVYTGADLTDLWAAPMPCAWPVTEDMLNPPHHPLAIDTVNYVGDGVAVVLADSDAIAHDAIEAIDVTYDPLEAVTDLEDALSDRVLERKKPLGDFGRQDAVAVSRKILRIAQKMPRDHLELRHIGILRRAADQPPIELAIFELELTPHLADRNGAFHRRHRGHEHVVLFTGQTIGGQTLAGHFLARRLDRPDHDRVGSEALDLTLGLVSDPLGNR